MKEISEDGINDYKSDKDYDRDKDKTDDEVHDMRYTLDGRSYRTSFECDYYSLWTQEDYYEYEEMTRKCRIG